MTNKKAGALIIPIVTMLSMLILVILAIVFYIWAGNNLTNKQNRIVEGDAAKFNADRALAEFMQKYPALFDSANKQNDLKEWFGKKGYKDVEVNCESTECTITVGNGDKITEFRRTIYLPKDDSVKQITITGVIQYE